MKHALLDENNKVANLIHLEEGAEYGAPEGLTLAQVPDWVNIGDDADISAPVPPAITKADLKATLAARRWEVETMGITLHGNFLPTDERTQRIVGDLYFDAVLNPDLTIDSWTVGGVSRTITADDIKAMRNAGFAHVQRCFNVFRAISDKIDLGQLTTAEQVIRAFNTGMGL